MEMRQRNEATQQRERQVQQRSMEVRQQRESQIQHSAPVPRMESRGRSETESRGGGSSRRN
ncbi:MAG TPA: hypothetical protein PLX32_13755, partial [Niabella sp.]|nr:hypothetical protein [Niabella sp.]